MGDIVTKNDMRTQRGLTSIWASLQTELSIHCVRGIRRSYAKQIAHIADCLDCGDPRMVRGHLVLAKLFDFDMISYNLSLCFSMTFKDIRIYISVQQK